VITQLGKIRETQCHLLKKAKELGVLTASETAKFEVTQISTADETTSAVT